MNNITAITRAMISYNESDVLRINHALKVFSFASFIAHSEACTDEETFIIEAASLLHDIGIHNAEKKYNSCAGNYQEIEGPPVARDLLSPLSLPEDVLGRISFLIAHHHTYNKIEGIDYQILIEADFIVNIYEDNMNADQISSVKKKLFKTKSGIALIESLYEKQ